jgi:hypothetical protein
MESLPSDKLFDYSQGRHNAIARSVYVLFDDIHLYQVKIYLSGCKRIVLAAELNCVNIDWTCIELLHWINFVSQSRIPFIVLIDDTQWADYGK